MIGDAVGRVSTATVSSFLNAAGTIGRVTINERIEAASGSGGSWPGSPGPRDGWRALRERTWALVSARAEGISIRILAAAAGLSPSRVHQLVAGADLDYGTGVWPSGSWPDSSSSSRGYVCLHQRG